ncbi:unnamed protein product [Gordionus sp. m RMFG-2023]|uniref:dnaJ homolog subfamily C member 5-like isoform X2 n=1 Tax=Gordionus sp. m RMFG-2023 TaxID=3053472 RepID=UPI0030DEEA7C
MTRTKPHHLGLSTRSDSLYNIIGIQKDSNQDDIKKAYRKLALRLHPDKNLNNPEATERFQQVNRAYAVLSDPNKRNLYDQYGGLGLLIAEQLGENNVKAYFFLQSKICKAFLTVCGLLTCCFCCFCCFCCCNFCCGKFVPKFPDENGEYTNLKENPSSDDDEKQHVDCTHPTPKSHVTVTNLSEHIHHDPNIPIPLSDHFTINETTNLNLNKDHLPNYTKDITRGTDILN